MKIRKKKIKNFPTDTIAAGIRSSDSQKPFPAAFSTYTEKSPSKFRGRFFLSCSKLDSGHFELLGQAKRRAIRSSEETPSRSAPRRARDASGAPTAQTRQVRQKMRRAHDTFSAPCASPAAQTAPDSGSVASTKSAESRRRKQRRKVVHRGPRCSPCGREFFKSPF